ncbi:MAG: adenosine kinase [Bacteroidales bacterium]
MKSVLGLGNALVDMMTSLEDDELLQLLGLPKGSMTLVDKDFSDKVFQATSALFRTQTSGGSAANTIHGLAHLGIPASFIGKVGKDEFGEFFRRDMEGHDIQPFLLKSETESGLAVALISPDSERTFATYLGAAVELSAEDLDPEIFKNHDLFHIEGYLVQNNNLILRALEIAKSQGMIISLDLASYNVVEANLDFLQEVVRKYIDIVFANEEEARAFTGKQPAEALEILNGFCNIAVVKVGSGGSLIAQGEDRFHISPYPAEVIDTTGAGDLYAAGFLYGLVHGFTLEECGELGSLLAGNVIEVIGAKIDDDRWNKIHRYIKMMQ